MTKHRMSKTPEYHAWHHAKRRCNNPNDKSYPEYGAVGIKMDPAWEADFALFLAEVGRKPSPEHSLDRIKGHLGYVPGNVRWATKELQSQNRPKFVRLISHNGKSMTVAEWARELGQPASTLYRRLADGQPVEQVLLKGTKPPGHSHRMLTHEGKTQPLKTWARELGMVPSTIRQRLQLGWDVQRALTPLR